MTYVRRILMGDLSVLLFLSPTVAIFNSSYSIPFRLILFFILSFLLFFLIFFFLFLIIYDSNLFCPVLFCSCLPTSESHTQCCDIYIILSTLFFFYTFFFLFSFLFSFSRSHLDVFNDLIRKISFFISF